MAGIWEPKSFLFILIFTNFLINFWNASVSGKTIEKNYLELKLVKKMSAKHPLEIFTEIMHPELWFKITMCSY